MSGGHENLERLKRELAKERKQAERQQRRAAKRQGRGPRRLKYTAAAAATVAVAGAGVAIWWNTRSPAPAPAASGGTALQTQSATAHQTESAPEPSQETAQPQTSQLTVTPPAPDGQFPPSPGEARQELGALTVAKNENSGAYQRSAFGPGWGGYGFAPKLPNGCEARDEVLRRDLSDMRAGDKNKCIIFSGVLHDPYTGKELPYNRYKPSDIQIDHVVALGAAWRTGASKWDDQRRVEFANDINNMLAVDGQANNDKGSKTPDQWKPPYDFWCPYAERWIGVKHLYSLTVTAAEKSALEEMLNACPELFRSVPFR
jgi:hypothetical protein